MLVLVFGLLIVVEFTKLFVALPSRVSFDVRMVLFCFDRATVVDSPAVDCRTLLWQAEDTSLRIFDGFDCRYGFKLYRDLVFM